MTRQIVFSVMFVLFGATVAFGAGIMRDLPFQILGALLGVFGVFLLWNALDRGTP